MFQITSETSITLAEQETAKIDINLNLPVLNNPIYVDLHIPHFQKNDFKECEAENINLAMLHTSCRVEFPVGSLLKTNFSSITTALMSNFLCEIDF